LIHCNKLCIERTQREREIVDRFKADDTMAGQRSSSILSSGSIYSSKYFIENPTSNLVDQRT